MVLLTFVLIVLLIISYVSNEKVVLAPSFLFTASFVFSCFFATLFAQKWNLGPDIRTFLVIFLGCLEFIVISGVVKYFYGKSSDATTLRRLDIYEETWTMISTWKIYLIIFFEIITILITIKSLISITGTGNLSDAMYAYRRQLLFADDTQLIPSYVTLLRRFTSASGYFFGYLFIRKYLIEKKADFLLLIVIIVSGYCNILLGARTDAVVLVLGLWGYYYMYKRHQAGWRISGNTKLFVIGGAFLILFLLFFKQIAVLQGRTIRSTGLDYVAEYVGAEIKNLDLFVQAGQLPVIPSMASSQTLIYVNHLLAKIFSMPTLNYRLNLPFVVVNGIDMGNVRSTFYPFLYDLGYAGVGIFVGVMALVTQFTFERAKLTIGAKRPPISVLSYGYMISTLVFAFFSNKFYEQIFSSTYIYIVVFWVILDVFIFGVRKVELFK